MLLLPAKYSVPVVLLWLRIGPSSEQESRWLQLAGSDCGQPVPVGRAWPAGRARPTRVQLPARNDHLFVWGPISGAPLIVLAKRDNYPGYSASPLLSAREHASLSPRHGVPT